MNVRRIKRIKNGTLASVNSNNRGTLASYDNWELKLLGQTVRLTVLINGWRDAPISTRVLFMRASLGADPDSIKWSGPSHGCSKEALREQLITWRARILESLTLHEKLHYYELGEITGKELNS